LGPIGPVVSDEIIFRRFFAKFSIFSNGGGVVGHNTQRGPSEDHSTIVWVKFISLVMAAILVEIGPVVLEELIKMQKANDRRMTDAQW
jgi:hypothetical protein